MNKPSYYAVIPAGVRYDRRLPDGAKLLYGEISALCGPEGFCWATNRYFAGLYGVSMRTVTEWIAQLEKCGHIRCKQDGKSPRRIYLTVKLPGLEELGVRRTGAQVGGGDRRKLLGGWKKTSRGGRRKLLPSITRSITSKRSEVSPSKMSERELRRAVQE